MEPGERGAGINERAGREGKSEDIMSKVGRKKDGGVKRKLLQRAGRKWGWGRKRVEILKRSREKN